MSLQDELNQLEKIKVALAAEARNRKPRPRPSRIPPRPITKPSWYRRLWRMIRRRG